MKKWFVFLILLLVPTVSLLAQDGGGSNLPDWVAWILTGLGTVGTIFGSSKVIKWIKNLLKVKTVALANTGRELVELYGEVDDVIDEGKRVLEEGQEALEKIKEALSSDTPLTKEKLEEVVDELKDVLEAVQDLVKEVKEVPVAYKEFIEEAKKLFSKE